MPFDDLKQLMVRGLVSLSVGALSKTTEGVGLAALPRTADGQGLRRWLKPSSRLSVISWMPTTELTAMDIVRDVALVRQWHHSTLMRRSQGHVARGLCAPTSTNCTGPRCRVLLPEIERVIREDWLGIKGDIAGIDSEGPHDAAGAHRAWRSCRVNSAISCAWAGSPTHSHGLRLSRALGPAPNRHAATHSGWAVYDSEQD